MKSLAMKSLAVATTLAFFSFVVASQGLVFTLTPPRAGEWFVMPTPATLSHIVKNPQGRVLMGRGRAQYCDGAPFTGTILLGAVDPGFVERSPSLLPYPADAGLPRGYLIREEDFPILLPVKVSFERGLAFLELPFLPFGEPRIHLAVRVKEGTGGACLRIVLEDIQRL